MTLPIRTLVVDDEPLAREGIRLRLRDQPGLVVVGECADGAEALESIAELQPDVVFLDVQMPGLTGFDVVEELGGEGGPAVVFVTAYDEFALRAFEVHALDYILKPFDDERFAETLRRVRARMAERRAGMLEQRLAGLLGDLQAAAPPGDKAYPRRLAVRDAAKIVFIDVETLDWVEADGDYVRLHCAATAHMVRRTMAQMEKRLDPDRFARIHRSTIVNVDRIRELRPTFHNEYVVVLTDGTRLKLSRGYRPRVQELLDAAL